MGNTKIIWVACHEKEEARHRHRGDVPGWCSDAAQPEAPLPPRSALEALLTASPPGGFAF